MALILNIESATNVCSVALAKDGNLISHKEKKDTLSHSSILTVFIEQLLSDADKVPVDLDAIAVSNGPGSYTGLRIGLSVAKGLCYALDIPLIQIDSLLAIAGMVDVEEGGFVCPMLDARRNEAYIAVFDSKLKTKVSTQPCIIDLSFEALIKPYMDNLVFAGNASFKAKSYFGEDATISSVKHSSSKGMVIMAESMFKNQEFADLAYSVPNYIKGNI